jgi:hypothetical protein
MGARLNAGGGRDRRIWGSAAARWPQRPNSQFLSRYRSDPQKITNLEGIGLRIDYTGLQEGGAEEMKSNDDYVEG